MKFLTQLENYSPKFKSIEKKNFYICILKGKCNQARKPFLDGVKKSDQKQIKESSIDQKLTQRFIERLTYLKEGLSIPRKTKKITAVHETVGRIKDR